MSEWHVGNHISVKKYRIGVIFIYLVRDFPNRNHCTELTYMILMYVIADGVAVVMERGGGEPHDDGERGDNCMPPLHCHHSLITVCPPF